MKHPALIFPLLAVLLIPTGCLRPGKSPNVSFYQLRSASPAPGPVGEFAEVLMVGPVELSPYLNTPRMVTRPSSHQVGYRDLHRWAEPLDQNIANVMAQDLSALLTSKRIYAYSPRIPLQNNHHSIRIRIHTFEVDESGQASLDASAVHLLGNETLKNPIVNLKLKGPVAGATPVNEVEALNALIHQLSTALAREILQVDQTP